MVTWTSFHGMPDVSMTIYTGTIPQLHSAQDTLVTRDRTASTTLTASFSMHFLCDVSIWHGQKIKSSDQIIRIKGVLPLPYCSSKKGD